MKSKGDKMNFKEKLLITILLLLVITLTAKPIVKSRSEVMNDKAQLTKVYDFEDAHEKPEIDKGERAIYANLRYPLDARKKAQGGSVTLKFICEIDGSVNNVEIVKEEPTGFGFGQAAVEAVKKVKLTPGKDIEGKLIAVEMTRVISFKIK
jgi:TonB family protein